MRVPVLADQANRGSFSTCSCYSSVAASYVVRRGDRQLIANLTNAHLACMFFVELSLIQKMGTFALDCSLPPCRSPGNRWKEGLQFASLLDQRGNLCDVTRLCNTAAEIHS